MESNAGKLKSMQVLFVALLMGQGLFLAIAIFIVRGGNGFPGYHPGRIADIIGRCFCECRRACL